MIIINHLLVTVVLLSLHLTIYVDGVCCPPFFFFFIEKNHSVKTVIHPIGKRILLNYISQYIDYIEYV